ncbi:hypothetical protein [Photobacterium galatheae]|uniref:Uncharacterized protein n=1 Tax=Photobacterium galatheae TaxID=1654360 RepID=A0A066S131_9GAMM|nr:hypothetical protein [Photobacterium galatheae]KDM93343.1 hypothetical protein EA58_01660 [Photobacterium galatheae]MCM0150465.1 hypothetical protein [Photobacterium galatheae]
MKNKLALVASLFVANSAYATVELYSGENHCSLDAALESKAFNKHANTVGTLEAIKQKQSEQMGATENGYFIFNPTYLRTERYFNCSVPLNANIGQFNLTVHGTTEDLNQSNGGCTISRFRKVSDGGQDKWLNYGTGKGFDWIDLSDSNVSGEQFVTYRTTLNNDYDDNAILTFKCRTTWAEGSVSVGQIELSY